MVAWIATIEGRALLSCPCQACGLKVMLLSGRCCTQIFPVEDREEVEG